MGSHKDNRYHQIKRVFEEHNSKAVKKLISNHDQFLKSIKYKGINVTGGAIIAATLLASSPSEPTSSNEAFPTIREASENQIKDEIRFMSYNKRPLTIGEEEKIASHLSHYTGLNLKVTLDGNRLNEIIGYIGAEQHLYRWEGDSLSKHGYKLSSGIAPNKGAFGYFDSPEQEQYYIAAQIHMLPDWNERWTDLKPWYRFRKVLVYNPDNGKQVVAVIGDAGPADFTGKTFGGSPEIMDYLGRVDGSRKGKVIVLFIDDPDNKIALGPLEPAETMERMASNK